MGKIAKHGIEISTLLSIEKQSYFIYSAWLIVLMIHG